MKRSFDKMHGLGNDFVIVDARREAFGVTQSLARAIADRRLGVGCDQLIVLEPSEIADLRMRIWNSDGSEVESCGNATRCVVQLTGVQRIETAGGILSGDCLGAEVEVAFGEPRFDWDQIPLAYPVDTRSLPLAWGDLEHGQAVNVGNPHIVFFVDDVNSIELERIGPTIENDALFPQRVNVNVAQMNNGTIHLRTWERGAGLTLACGTGACAAAVAAIRSRRASSPVDVTMPGGTLTIAWAPGEAVRMRGSGTHIFSGEVDLEALQ